jgi:LPXTG-motif cell wall-anchored protein
MRFRLAAATFGATAALTLGAAFTTGAVAQDYPGGTTEERVDASQAERVEVLGEELIRPAAEVAPAAAVAPTDAVLPVTGGDLVGLVVLGAGLVGVGTLVVRRTRRPAAA